MYLFLFIFCLTGGILGFFVSQADPPYHRITMRIESSRPVETQLFYGAGKGFNENESIKQVVYQTNIPVMLDFSFPGRNIRALRFDPSRSAAKIIIHEIILKYQGEKPFTVPLDSLTAVNDIKSLHYDGRALPVETTEAAQDPILYLSRIGPAPHAFKLRELLFILAGAIISLVIFFFVIWAYRNCMNGKETVWLCIKGEA